jgi:hypothetical protein
VRLPHYALLRPDAEGAEGVGAIRDFALGPLHSHEQLIEIESDHVLRYSIIGGVPIRDHHATITLHKGQHGTKITWQEDFRPVVPGTPMAALPAHEAGDPTWRPRVAAAPTARCA